MRTCCAAPLYAALPPLTPLGDLFAADWPLLIVLCVAVLLGLPFAAVKAVRFVRARLQQDPSVQEDNRAYLELDLDEQELFFQAKEYLANFAYDTKELSLLQSLMVQEKAIRAWEFVLDPMLLHSDMIVVNRCELTFFKRFECSSQTNLPMPNTNDVYYFESKIYSLTRPDETIVSIGLGIHPYPWFRLPGRHAYSVCYDSDGYRRYNQPFKFSTPAPFPRLIEGDVVGIGYKTRTGTVFFTRNGKKLSELKIGGHVQNFKPPGNGRLYPIIGANNLCSVDVNIGQMGYVFIEANVKKWGFAPLKGTGPAPPAYQKFNGDILLERSEIHDENDLSERESDFPPDFWVVHPNEGLEDIQKFSFNGYSDHSADERITLHSLIPELPPNYDSNELAPSDAEQPEESCIASEEPRSAFEDASSHDYDSTTEDTNVFDGPENLVDDTDEPPAEDTSEEPRPDEDS